MSQGLAQIMGIQHSMKGPEFPVIVKRLGGRIRPCRVSYIMLYLIHPPSLNISPTSVRASQSSYCSEDEFYEHVEK